MSIFKKLKKCGELCQPDNEKIRKVAKTGIVALAFGSVLVVQTTVLGKIATCVANPVLRGVAQGVTIGGSCIASGLIGYKGTNWIFSYEREQREAFLNEELRKLGLQ